MDIAILICTIIIIGLLTVLLIKPSNKRDDSYKDLYEQLEKIRSENAVHEREQRPGNQFKYSEFCKEFR